MKYKGSTKKLTRLILAALFLNSSIYLPMAGAQEYNVPSDDSDSSKMTKTSADFQYIHPKNGASGDIVNFKGTGVTYQTDCIAGFYLNSSAAGTYSNRHTNILAGSGSIFGAFGVFLESKGDATNNYLTFYGGTLRMTAVAGSTRSTGKAEDNTLTIKNISFPDSPPFGAVSLYGGNGGSGGASRNHVIIDGGTFTDKVNIYGGFAYGNADSNTVTINNYQGKIGNIYVGWGSGGTSTNNALIIGKSGLDLQSTNVYYTQILKVGDGITFDPTTYLCKTTGKMTTGGTSTNSRPDKVDITGLTLGTNPSFGEMSLFHGATNFNGIKVVRQNGTAEQTVINSLSESEQQAGIDAESTVESSTDHPDVAFTYKNRQTMYVKNNYDIMYKNTGAVSNVALGTMTWSGSARSIAANTYTFDGTTAIDPSALTISGTVAFTADPLAGDGQSRTLLTGATGLTVDNVGALGDAGVVNTQITSSNMKLNGTTKGALSVTSGTLKYTLNSGTLTSVDLTGWGGGSITLSDKWSSGLTEGEGNESINADGFSGPASNTDIITAKAGFFNDNQIKGNKKYSAGTELVDDIAKGVTINGYKTGGVKASDDGAKLQFFAGSMDGRTIKLGDMTFGDGRTVDNSYNFANTTTVDASNLNFTGFKSPDTADSIGQGSTTTLLSGGKNLPSNISVTGASNSQDISFTDAKGVKLSGTLTGDVTTAADKVDYTVSAKTLNKVDLTDWDGTDAGTVTATWTAPTSGSVAVDTGNFTVTPGSTNILTLANGTFGSITGAKAYTEGGAFSGDTVKGVTLSGTKAGGVRANTTNAAILEYVAETKKPTSITLGNNMKWKDGRAADGSYDFTNVTSINASNLKFTDYATGYSADTIQANDTMALLSSATNLASGLTVTGASNSQDISFTNAQGIKLSGTLTGTVSTSNTAGVGQVDYNVGGKTLEKLDLSSWTGATTTTVDVSWQPPAGGQIAVDTGTFTPPSVAPGSTIDIFTAPTGTTFGTVTGTRTYKNNEPFKDPAKSGVTLEGTTSGGVQKNNDSTKLTYTGIGNTVSKITLGKITSPTATFGSEYSFTGASVDDSGLSFENPENIGNNDSVTLFTSANSMTPSVSPTVKNVSYSTTPVTGVTLNGQITGSYSNTNNEMTYNATGNNAQKLTFGNVEWKDTGALIDHSTTLTKVNFNGANVDTSNINFTNIKELEANKQMTLVSNYGGTPGSITGSKYKVGSTLQGDGKASMDGNNLIFTADTTAEKMEVQEQTHNTLMGASATMTSLAQGNEFINTTMDDMFLDANVGRDGIASFAHIGGGSLRQETGSHVNTHTWNAIVAFGHQNKKPRNTFEYGAFAEYGTGNFTTYNGDLRGDGSSRYVGGGVLAKWTAPSGLYVEGSVRAGSVHEDGSNLLQDINGVPYSYSTDTPYYGVHLGVGKKIPMKGGSVLDVYARYFYNHRNSTSFDAGGHYDLDAITSQVIRVGARYTVKRDKWNYYGGLAYEHELDGKAGGWADGMPIRGVDTGGGSFRAELGATIKPNDDIPLTLDLTLTGFAGKKQGLFGGVGLKFNF